MSGHLPQCYLGGGESEWGEREIARRYTTPDMSILEFGGGAGSVSTVIQDMLWNKTNHTVIQPKEGGSSEPMMGGYEQLMKNKTACNMQFHAIDHVLEKGEGAAILGLVSKPYDTIVADCEGCLVGEYEKNPDLFANVSTVQVERDDGGTYDDLFVNKLHLTMVDAGKGLGCDGACDTQVWKRM